MAAVEYQTIENEISLSDNECKKIGNLVHQQFGITLFENKRSLIRSRLQKIFKTHSFRSFDEFYQKVSSDKSGRTLSLLIDHLATNHTFFNRENAHFKFFSEVVLPQLFNKLKLAGQKNIRIWCAGCSTGEESYTLAILLLEYLKKEAGAWDIGILATDISEKALNKASAGIYTNENIAKLPIEWKKNYFRKLSSGVWETRKEVKNLVLHRRLNLMRPEFPFNSKFDTIFCRNVMIYFDDPSRSALINRFYRFTAPEGYFFIGHSETLNRESCPYNYVAPSIYRKER